MKELNLHELPALRTIFAVFCNVSDEGADLQTPFSNAAPR